MFEAIHGSAPRRAGQNMANPSGLLLGGVMMLVHIGQTEAASLIHNAWLTTLEEGIHTYDIYDEAVSKKKVGTKEFADAVIANLGKKPSLFPPKEYHKTSIEKLLASPKDSTSPSQRKLLGVDFFVKHNPSDGTAEQLAARAKDLLRAKFSLQMITNRGVKVWPEGHPETFCIDQWRCRFMQKSSDITLSDIADLMRKADEKGLDIIKTENLYAFDQVKRYSHAE
jgi:isocitrate dehydrogenase